MIVVFLIFHLPIGNLFAIVINDSEVSKLSHWEISGDGKDQASKAALLIKSSVNQAYLRTNAY